MPRPYRADRLSPALFWLAITWLGLLAGALAMSIWAAIDDHFPGDVAVGRWIQAHDLPGRDLSQFLRDVGSTPPAAATLLLAVLLLIAIRHRRVALVVAAFATVFGIQRGLKLLIDRPRTSVLFLDQHGTFDSPSFPSGHVMSSALVGLLLVYLCWRLPGPLWLRLPIATWGLGVGLLQPWASISAGVHWPSDTLGGFVWAVLIMLPLLVLMQRWAFPRDARPPRNPQDPRDPRDLRGPPGG